MKDIIQNLNILKKEKNAVVLAHIYQQPEIHDIADFVGDSLELSRKAAKTKEEVIVFCGVHFMAETASIINPQKKVLIPDMQAGCPMADMVNVEKLKEFKSRFRNPIVMSYVNTSAAVKAESDICCTSSNAINVVKSVVRNLGNNIDIIFTPDRNLGRYIQKVSGIRMNIWDGFCPTHNNFILPEHVKTIKNKYLKAEILAHPECRAEVLELADYVLSTGGMCKRAKESACKEFIICTETGILHKLQKDNPDKKFYAPTDLAVCPNMKKITLEKVYDVLVNIKNIVCVPDNIRQKAYTPISKMLEINAEKVQTDIRH
ncbi:MAG: quinolinate synthase NadA [Endomicrobium sp.]|jgi:quinolinate synthase|nr:quinolinate synthase NadA [Endomicrobium sp.]